MRSRLALALALLTGCYTLGAPAPAYQRVFVEVADHDGIDVDLAALMAASAREAIAARPELSLSGRSDADVVLRLALDPSIGGLTPFADTARRAPEYRVEVRVHGTLIGGASEALWGSGPVAGEARYSSHPGSIVALDGARRLALARAAEDAARRVVTAMLYAR